MQENLIYNIEAEQAVLGSILLEPYLLRETSLQPFHFSPGSHENLFWVLRDMDNKQIPVDFLAIVERVGKNKIEHIGGMSYLNDLMASVPSVANFKFYEGLIVDYFQKRKAQEVAVKLNREELTVQEAISELMTIEDNSTDDDDGDLKNDLFEVFSDLEKSNGDVTGVKSGFSELDRMTTGWQEQDLVIVGARPSMGKTAFVLNIARNAAKGPSNPDGDVVGIFSLEMSRKQLLKRMISINGNINGQAMRLAGKKFSQDDWSKAALSISEINAMDLKIFDKPGVDVNYIWSKVRKMKNLYPNRKILIMIDYLQLIQGSAKHKGNRMQEISEISRMLKHMARELKVCVIALSQLSRSVESRQDKRPMMSDLRESGQIEQDADVITFLYRDDYYKKDSEFKNVTEVIIAKQRNGPVGTVQLAFIKEFGKFVSLEKRLVENEQG